jgi:hypothetical protein
MYPNQVGYDPALNRHLNQQRFSLNNMSMVRFGLGFFRGFTRVKDADQYASSATLPTVHIAYETLLRSGLRVGAQTAFGRNRFSRQEFDTYDSLQFNKTLNENIFTLHVYGRYTIGDVMARLQPYVMGGVGLHSSFVRSTQQIQFVEQGASVLEVRSGSRSLGLGLLVRGGAEYYLNPQLRAFGDVGTGPALLQLGIALYLQQ